MQERGKKHQAKGCMGACPRPTHLSCVVFWDALVHIRAVGSVDHNPWGGVSAMQRTQLRHTRQPVAGTSLFKIVTLSGGKRIKDRFVEHTGSQSGSGINKLGISGSHKLRAAVRG